MKDFCLLSQVLPVFHASYFATGTQAPRAEEANPHPGPDATATAYSTLNTPANAPLYRFSFDEIGSSQQIRLVGEKLAYLDRAGRGGHFSVLGALFRPLHHEIWRPEDQRLKR